MSLNSKETNGKKLTAAVGNIQKFSVEDGPGIRTTVFLKGCPLSCRWCHNPEMTSPKQDLIHSPNSCIRCGACMMACMQNAIKPDKERGIVIAREKCIMCLACTNVCFAEALRPVAKYMSVSEVVAEAEQDKGFYENTGGGITLSGGELLMQPEVSLAIIGEAAQRGINVCLDTTGYGDAEKLLEMARADNVTDILYDIKSIDDEVHRAYTYVSNEKILANLRRLAEDEKIRSKITIRMPLMAGVNDSDKAIRGAGQIFSELGLSRVTLLPYHNLGIAKARNIGSIQEEFAPPDEDRLEEIITYFRDEMDMEVAVLGRV